MVNNSYTFRAFTLVEIMVWVLIFSIIIIWWFKAYSWVLLWKIKLIEWTDIQKEAFYFSEKFFEEVKKGGTIDYEEYFNREVVWTTVINWFYSTPTWFWNFWNVTWPAPYGDWFYYCRSWIWLTNLMGTGWCVATNNNSLNSQVWEPQRYRQYGFQFIDYNSNYNADWTLPWDEDWDSNIIWDDDDEYLWLGPVAFSWSEVKEIYLISADKKSRTMFRWNIMQDNWDPQSCIILTWEHCRWTIEFLKLEWKDWWYDHDTSNWAISNEGEFDGLIDTWLINPEFSWWTEVIAQKSITDYWQPLFGKNINVSNVKFFAYPNKDLNLAWKDASATTNIAPYIRIQMTLSPSYNARKWIKWSVPKVNINTTISLTDIYSR